MKRYYSIDFTAMKHYGLNPTKWMVCENIHFICGVSDDGHCQKTRQEMADHHDLSLHRFKHIVGELVDDKLLKRNKKNHLKTTPKWHKIYSAKDSTLDDLGSAKNSTLACQKQHDPRAKNSTSQPIRENLERVREIKNTKKDFRFLIEVIRESVRRKSKVEYTDKGFNAYLEIKDKSEIPANYIKHQADKDQFSQTLANFLLDYEANTTTQNVKQDNLTLGDKDYKGGKF